MQFVKGSGGIQLALWENANDLSFPDVSYRFQYGLLRVVLGDWDSLSSREP